MYDYNVERRVKLYHKISFSEELDMAPYVRTHKRSGAAGNAEAAPGKEEATRSTRYSLYAVLVHQGNAMGGHYYAYIKVRALCVRLSPLAGGSLERATQRRT